MNIGYEIYGTNEIIIVRKQQSVVSILAAFMLILDSDYVQFS